jgi:16S rRNA (guanine527-N7)-methyltransferase
MAMSRQAQPHQPDWSPRLAAAAGEFGITLPPPALDVLRVHLELLLRWNRKVNLTAIRDPEEMLRRHFGESLYLDRVIRLGAGLMYDIGTGAGFPGLPLKALHPEIKLVLVESSQKKAAFLKEVISAAGIEGARVEAERAEALARRSELELADWVTMRAVGAFDDLLPVIRRLLAPHGQAALFLGEADAEGVAGGGGFDWQAPVAIPHSQRRVILVGRALP